jgi:hypothetical protein
MNLSNKLVLGALAISLLPAVAFAAGNGTRGPLDAAVASLQPSQGHVLCTGAINSNGSVATANAVASHMSADPAKTLRLSTGDYQVTFLAPCADVRISRGFFRTVQPDTLTTGTLPIGSACQVADRAGVPAALFIRCYVGTTLTDMSFTVSVSR